MLRMIAQSYRISIAKLQGNVHPGLHVAHSGYRPAPSD